MITVGLREPGLLMNIGHAYRRFEPVGEVFERQKEMLESHAIWEIIGTMEDEIRKGRTERTSRRSCMKAMKT